MSNRLNQEREQELQPKRMDWAVKDITDMGFTITYQDETRLEFVFKGHVVKFFPYSGWYTGKSIKDGRGLMNLLKQLK